ncbi:molybdopterin cofactor-binding domain-containing protein [Chloroflexota bacterium]
MSDFNRREFIKVSAAAGASLLVSVYLQGCTNRGLGDEDGLKGDPEALFEPSVFLRIGGDNTVTVTVPTPEVGQGIGTGLPMIVAEELNADWSTIRIEQAVADVKYGNQTVAGSMSVRHFFTPLRKAAALAKAMLLAAGANALGVPKKECFTQNGMVIHVPTDRKLTYGELAAAAAKRPIPDKDEQALKDVESYTLLGTPVDRIDGKVLYTGEAVYGLDVRRPGMLYAVVARSPVYEGKLVSYDDSDALKVPGVRQVVEISNGVAVLAENTWTAIRGRRALQVEWDLGSNLEEKNSAAIMADLVAKAEQNSKGGEGILEINYEIPYLAHATMEPMNCTAEFQGDQLLVWAPTQRPQLAQQTAAQASGLPIEKVTVHIPYVGGGFGRRLEQDYVTEAVEIAQQVEGPVQVVFTRKDDFQRDYFHEMNIMQCSSPLDPPAMPEMSRRRSKADYIPVTGWRSVENFNHAFARECFIDEMAIELGRDPVELRMEIYDREQTKGVLALAAEKADWGQTPPNGWSRGLASFANYGRTAVAHVMDISISAQGVVTVHKVVTAINCGIVINPDMIANQMEGGIVWALSAALNPQVSIVDGRVQQSNFHDHPIMTFSQTPEIEVHIIPGTNQPFGVGEVGVPQVVPALLSAIYAATGKRFRRVPVLPEDLLG